MKVFFKRFLKEYSKRKSYQDLTIKFNSWYAKLVSIKKKKSNKGMLPNHAFTNKFTVRKWCEKLDIKVNAL